MPAAVEWFASIENPRTRRAYQTDIRDFMTYIGIIASTDFRTGTRARVIAWRKALKMRSAAPATIRRKLAALSSVFEHLCEANAVMHNRAKGVNRPKTDMNEGKTPAISDAHARALADAPDPETLEGKRDRAILSIFLLHGLRRAELCQLEVRDLQGRRGVSHLRIRG